MYTYNMPKTNPNKRMVYLWDENVDFYEHLENKSDFVNQALKAARIAQSREVKDDRISYVHQKVAEIDEANRQKHDATN